MKKLITVTLAAGSLAASLGTHAENREAVLISVQAPVMVNQGETYVDATERMALTEGDRLMVMQGGSAQIHYANGCVQALGANEITTVGTEDACMNAGAAGTYNQVGSTTGAGGTPPPKGLTTAQAAVSFVVAGGIAYEITDDANRSKLLGSSAQEEGDRDPASP